MMKPRNFHSQKNCVKKCKTSIFLLSKNPLIKDSACMSDWRISLAAFNRRSKTFDKSLITPSTMGLHSSFNHFLKLGCCSGVVGFIAWSVFLNFGLFAYDVVELFAKYILFLMPKLCFVSVLSFPRLKALFQCYVNFILFVDLLQI